MGAETAAFAGLTAANQIYTRHQDKKYAKQEAARKDALLDSQLNERIGSIKDERNRKAAYLRARYGASGVRTNSRSAQNLLRALNENATSEINHISSTRSLKTPTERPSDDFGHFLSVLKNLQAVKAAR